MYIINKCVYTHTHTHTHTHDCQVALVVKNLLANTSRRKRRGFDSWVWKIPWRRAWRPTPVLLPEESHGQWSLVGYSP